MIHLSPETELLALKLAAAQAVSPDDAIRAALERRAREEGLLPVTAERQATAETFAARQQMTEALVAKFARLPVLDPRSPGEIMDDLGSP